MAPSSLSSSSLLSSESAGIVTNTKSIGNKNLLKTNKSAPRQTRINHDDNIKRLKGRQPTNTSSSQDQIKTPASTRQVPLEVLEQISSQVLEYTKQLGLFDELRMKLLERIEARNEFATISENFHIEVDAFCRGPKVKLDGSRAQLRQQLQEQCELKRAGGFRSTARLDESVAHVIRKYEFELRREYEAKRTDLVKQISSFELSINEKPKISCGLEDRRASKGEQVARIKESSSQKSATSDKGASRKVEHHTTRLNDETNETRLSPHILPKIPTPNPSVSPQTTPTQHPTKQLKQTKRRRRSSSPPRRHRFRSSSPERCRRVSVDRRHQRTSGDLSPSLRKKWNKKNNMNNKKRNSSTRSFEWRACNKNLRR